jgi:hypothetical protein
METAAKAREAEDEALAFAMIGYGFNDSHLHGVIYDRVRSQDCPLLVLTLDIADETITELCTLGKKVWILLAQKSAPGGSDRSHTVIYSPCSDYAPIVFRDERLWSCDCFAERILGG